MIWSVSAPSAVEMLRTRRNTSSHQCSQTTRGRWLQRITLSWGVMYLVVVNYFLRFSKVIELRLIISRSIIDATKTLFARYWIPEVVRSDNGLQYTSAEFVEFATKYDFTHITSSPYYPQGNGLVERTVKTVKKLLKGSKDLCLALLAYQTTMVWKVPSGAESRSTPSYKHRTNKRQAHSQVVILWELQERRCRVQTWAEEDLRQASLDQVSTRAAGGHRGADHDQQATHWGDSCPTPHRLEILHHLYQLRNNSTEPKPAERYPAAKPTGETNTTTRPPNPETCPDTIANPDTIPYWNIHPLPPIVCEETQKGRWRMLTEFCNTSLGNVRYW